MADTWLSRILATRCPLEHSADGEPCDSIPGAEEDLFCASRIQAAEGAEQKKSARDSFTQEDLTKLINDAERYPK